MTRFHIFAARDGDTYSAHFEAADEDAAKAAARPLIAAQFGLQWALDVAQDADDPDPDYFDAELDGFRADVAGEPCNMPPIGEQLLADLHAFIAGVAFQSKAATAERDRLLREIGRVRAELQEAARG
jgi:hypothetical protein